jgi:STE24 endopeptidase
MKLGSIARAIAAAFFTFLFVAALPAAAQVAAPTSHVNVAPLAPPVAANRPAPAFDADKATNAYLAQISGAARAKSNAYFEGGYWLILIDTLYALAVAALLLWSRVSAGIRNWAQARTRSRFWQVPIYVAAYTALTAVLSFPLTAYEEFFREQAYGMSNQTFGGWFADFGKDFLLQIVASIVVLTIIYAVIRAARQTWWLWGTLVVILFSAFASMIFPVFVAPMFNDYTPLKDGPLKQEILSLARANEVPATNVYEFNASKQTKRISANVSGFAGTTRISLNDNLMNRSKNKNEIIAVLGHEMGHYALGHNYTGFTWFGLVFFVGFAFVNFGFRFITGIFGGNWDVRTIDDPAGLPVIMALMAIFFFFATPVTNTITRTFESQADLFGVNAARQPDAFAQATLQLSEYRKLDPSPWEEFIFYDHPSGRTRIHMMMQWKAEHLNDCDIKAGPVSPQ